MRQADELLLRSFKEGNVEAFENLFNRYYSALCIYANKIVGDMDRARDITQDVFVTIYENRSAIVIKSSIKAYLYRSVYHACLNHLKQTEVHGEHHAHIISQYSASDGHDAMIQAELEEQIWAEIQKLPEQCRNIFQMNRFEGRKNKEIANTLGISIRTVETQISKALKILRKNLSHLMPALLLLTLAA